MVKHTVRLTSSRELITSTFNYCLENKFELDNWEGLLLSFILKLPVKIIAHIDLSTTYSDIFYYTWVEAGIVVKKLNR